MPHQRHPDGLLTVAVARPFHRFHLGTLGTRSTRTGTVHGSHLDSCHAMIIGCSCVFLLRHTQEHPENTKEQHRRVRTSNRRHGTCRTVEHRNTGTEHRNRGTEDLKPVVWPPHGGVRGGRARRGAHPVAPRWRCSRMSRRRGLLLSSGPGPSQTLILSFPTTFRSTTAITIGRRCVARRCRGGNESRVAAAFGRRGARLALMDVGNVAELNQPSPVGPLSLSRASFRSCFLSFRERR